MKRKKFKDLLEYLVIQIANWVKPGEELKPTEGNMKASWGYLEAELNRRYGITYFNKDTSDLFTFQKVINTARYLANNGWIIIDWKEVDKDERERPTSESETEKDEE